ncbi:HlyD family type I secretion periplasmic adaptor subunit [Testudinibacter sp. TR-2022]|uniref:HlyD family type I secretion periplasmic adaptor subunit n=1 Tax=Testudinibacter sp. TR-2022 TaxID=2585029 RepID=UPI00111B62CF|nr:HlyD family type I secretion periplasmic adaptor subunit [Testudinibacter sp. TR-2022]TNH04778.1 HlyD family type I secretion periplasmic adaptor subunit [Pasteurellaceae bacterium Phil31]TNH10248.1 HlyD family type I secretion periplasmic adaptor subunit [Testudinibacter sp. TR-2022]TNH12131.1 HlyD family type I secretion periplasmic adaptor subunit [Testudinibacter sp. TR-2022]TNH12763.1 HlyD family type I secretion periplasmic adaptor subunit [Testudinibacter sp. TR-2022]TNH18112.1 HlyD 
MSDNETKVEKSNHVVTKAEADKLKQQPKAKHREQYSKQDLKLLTDLNAAIQQEKHKGLFWSIILLFAFLVVFVIWSYNSTLEEVTRGQGSIIPSSREQVIQSLDPGILSEMMVKEGDLVEKGQVLLKLDDTRSSAGLRESQAKVQNLAAVVTRLEAEAYNRELKFADDTSQELIERETAVYNSHKQALKESINSLSESKTLLDREIAMTTPMVAKGAVSEVEVLRMRRQSSELQLQIVERQNKYVTDANSELVRVQSELQQARENMAMRADPVERSLIRSPLKGIVKNIRVNTIGGVISAGQDIMEIVPVEEKLVVEAYISPRDVAYVRPGMKALVKLSAYDYAIYGGLDGIVTLLSPDTLHDQKRPSDLKLNANEAYYRVLVTTESSTLTDKNGEELPIIPGMIATIDIKTGEKTVFQYLIKPITRMKQALQER